MKRVLQVTFLSVLMVSLFGCGITTNTSTTESSNVLRVGMECNYAPFNWSTTESNEFTVQFNEVDYADGYDVVIAKRIADGLGKELEIHKMDWGNLIPGVQNGEIDLIIAGMTDTEERRESVLFTSPYYVSEEVVIVRKDSPLASITNIQEMSGYKVAGQQATIYADIIDQIEGVNKMPDGTDFPSLINDLKQGSIDAVTSELPVAVGVASANPDLTYVQFEGDNGFAGSETDASVSIALAIGREDLRDQIQEILDTISEEERQAIMLDAVNRQPAVSE